MSAASTPSPAVRRLVTMMTAAVNLHGVAQVDAIQGTYNPETGGMARFSASTIRKAGSYGLIHVEGSGTHILGTLRSAR